jgi:hypothetical protein
MAAGMGKRYGGSKQTDPVGPSGEFIIDYSVHDAVRAGFAKVIFVIRRDMAQAFRDQIGRAVEKRVETAYVFQENDALPGGAVCPPARTKPWGTGHAVLCARDAVDAPFAVINADDFYGAGAFEAIGHRLKCLPAGSRGDYCLVAYYLRETLSDHGGVARGVCTTTDGLHLATIVERFGVRKFPDGIKYADGDNVGPIDDDSLVSTNMWGFTGDLFEHLESGFADFLASNIDDPQGEYLLPSVVDNLIRSQTARVRILVTDEQCSGLTYKADKPDLERRINDLVRRGRYPANLRA